MTDPRDLTIDLVRRTSAGDERATSELFALAYDELHQKARRLMARQPAEHTLQASALVNEVWIQLTCKADRTWQNSVHFTAVAARAMRQVLIDHARAKAMDKRGGGARRLELVDVHASPDESAWKMLALHEALGTIAQADEQAHRVAELRIFGGLEHEEIAQALGVSTRTVERSWRGARDLVREHLGD